MLIRGLVAFGLLAVSASGTWAADPLSPPALGREYLDTLKLILRGEDMGPGKGWFHPSQGRYSWAWLAGRHGIKPSEPLPREKFRGPADLFDRLDRDRDGALKAEDFDWSDTAPFMRQMGQARQLLRPADGDRDGKLSRKEWDAMFEKAAAGKDHLTDEDLRFLLAPPRPAGPPPKGPDGVVLLKGLLAGEIGSPFEGPAVGGPAPDFTLPTADGLGKVTLSSFRGKAPVVLIFGSFT
jgi:hypothetical protein